MRKIHFGLFTLLLLTGCTGSTHQAPRTPEVPAAMDAFASYDAFRDHLITVTDLQDPFARADAEADLWAALQARGVPFVDGERVAFLYRGQANQVTFTGDFSGWRDEPQRARRLGNSDLWLQEENFPVDARLDYKVVVDGRWMLDPENPAVQRSGFGDNSELAMPGHVPSDWAERKPDVPRGHLKPAEIRSKVLGHSVDLLIYTPVGYDDLDDLPVMYVTDGHEYADDVMGSCAAVLDNLIHAGKLRPVMAVFIDPRLDGKNLRRDLYVLNPRFVEFVAGELVPMIDELFDTSRNRADRGILGTSLGGLNSAYFAYEASDTFKRIAIQSPAFHAGEGRIIDLYRESPRLDVDIFMTWGTFFDFGETTDEFQLILDDKGYDYEFRVVNEGHSWGNWRALLDDIFLAFWPNL